LESQIQSIGYEDLSARLIDEEKGMRDFGVNIGAGTGSFNGTESNIVKTNMAKFAGRVCHQCRQSRHLARDCLKRLKNVQYNWCEQFGHKETRCKVKEFQVENSETSKERQDALRIGDCRFWIYHSFILMLGDLGHEVDLGQALFEELYCIEIHWST